MQRTEKNPQNIILFIDSGNLDSNKIKDKIKLLRTSDAIKSLTTLNALDFLEKNLVNIIILYSKNNNSQILSLLKVIKENKKLNAIPKVLIEEECDSDYLIEAYDSNIDDIIHKNTQDWEFLARIIKLLNKNAQNTIEEIKNSILYKLEIFEKENKIFGEKYCEKVMEYEISQSAINNIQSSILSVALKSSNGEKTREDFEASLKDNLRADDTIVKTQEGYYYIFLHNTKLSGAYSLFEKLKNKLEKDFNMGIAIIDTGDEKFAEIDKKIKNGLSKTLKAQGTIAIVLNPNQTEEEPIVSNPQEERLTLKDIEVNNLEQDESFEIFNQTYKKKCELIIEPIFKKLKSLIDSENIPEIFIDYKVGFKKSKFEIISNSSEFYLTILYDGKTKVNINTVHILNNKMFDVEPAEFDIMEFSNEKLMNYVERVIKNVKL